MVWEVPIYLNIELPIYRIVLIYLNIELPIHRIERILPSTPWHPCTLNADRTCLHIIPEENFHVPKIETVSIIFLADRYHIVWMSVFVLGSVSNSILLRDPTLAQCLLLTTAVLFVDSYMYLLIHGLQKLLVELSVRSTESR